MNRILIVQVLLMSGLTFAQAPVSEQLERVDFKSALANITILPERAMVKGKVEYVFDVLEASDSIFVDAQNISFENVLLNGAPVEFRNNKKQLWVIGRLDPSEENILSFNYTATPKQAMYFINWNAPENVDPTRQVWTQGQGRDNSHWLPSFDDMREKVIFNLTVNFRNGYEVAANGRLADKRELNDSITRWSYEMKEPMSSYLVAVAAGNYEKEERRSSSGVPVTLYYSPENEHKAEPTYRYSREIFDFFETEIGHAYPWQNYKQIPVQDFLFSGMENTGTTIFTNSLVIDSVAYNDQNYVNVNAHELAHQWFGNFVTAETGEHHWLHEGFATYYALLAEKMIFGDDYYFWKLYETAEQLKEMSDEGKGEALLSTSASSLTYYQKGAWALVILKEKMGEKAFKNGVQSFLQKYAYENATTDDFLAEMEEASGMDLSRFKKDWLQQSAFQGTEALNYLKNSRFITDYLQIAALRETALENKIDLLERALDFPVNDYIGQEVVFQLAGSSDPEVINLYRKAFESGNLYVRQAVALSVNTIPAELKPFFISLLGDKSYLTKENALLKLWMQYPGETEKWLKRTSGIDGFPNKNVRMLWLVINLVTPEVDPDKTREYFRELSGYTATHYPFEVRENAFGYLYQINAFTDQNLVDLLEGARHHTYRFRDFSRKLLTRLLETPEYREKYEQLREELSEENKEILEARLKI